MSGNLIAVLSVPSKGSKEGAPVALWPWMKGGGGWGAGMRTETCDPLGKEESSDLNNLIAPAVPPPRRGVAARVDGMVEIAGAWEIHRSRDRIRKSTAPSSSDRRVVACKLRMLWHSVRQVSLFPLLQPHTRRRRTLILICTSIPLI